MVFEYGLFHMNMTVSQNVAYYNAIVMHSNDIFNTLLNYFGLDFEDLLLVHHGKSTKNTFSYSERRGIQDHSGHIHSYILNILGIPNSIGMQMIFHIDRFDPIVEFIMLTILLICLAKYSL